MVLLRGFAGKFFEGFIKVGDVVEPAVVANLGNGLFVFNKQFAGMAYPQFLHKSIIVFVGMQLKKAAKSGGAYVGNTGYLSQAYFFAEMR